MRRTIMVIFVIALAFCLTACGCEHEWNEATCTTPKTCKLCQATEGEVKAHQWQDATCTAPKTCKDCGATEGDVADHTWESATCTTPKTCKLCKETDGKELGHDYKEDIFYDYVSAEALTIQTCSRCKDNAATSTPLSTLHNDEAFLMSPVEFCDRFTNTAVSLVEEMRSDGVNFQAEYLCYIDEEGTRILVNMNVARRLDGDDKKISIVGCLDPWREDNGLFFYSNKDVRGDIVCIRGPVQKEDASFVMLALIKTLNPTVDNTEAWELYEKWVQTGYTKADGLAYAWIPGEEPNTVQLSVYVG